MEAVRAKAASRERLRTGCATNLAENPGAAVGLISELTATVRPPQPRADETGRWLATPSAGSPGA